MVECVVVDFDGLVVVSSVDDPMAEESQIIRAGDFGKFRVVEATVQEIFEGGLRRIELLLFELFLVRLGSPLGVLEDGGSGSDARYLRISNCLWRVVQSEECDFDGGRSGVYGEN